MRFEVLLTITNILAICELAHFSVKPIMLVNTTVLIHLQYQIRIVFMAYSLNIIFGSFAILNSYARNYISIQTQIISLPI